MLRQSSARRGWGSPLPLAPINVQADVPGLVDLPGAAQWDENGTHGCHPTTAALPVCMAGPGLHWHRRSREVCDDGRWLWSRPRAVLAVGWALPGTGSIVLGWREATTQLVPPGRAALASHALQLLKASEQLLIVPDAANEIIAARRWEPLPGPCCWGQGCSARLPQALAATGFGEHPGHPLQPQPPLTFAPSHIATAHW